MIAYFKLWGGEEVIAEVDDDGEWCETMEMRRPFRNLLTNQGSMLMPYPCDSITVSVNHVLFRGKPNDDLEQAYREVTGKIAVPTHKLQVP